MLEKNSPKPLYQQLKDILVDAIDSEKWKANEKIPSENELSSIYGLSRMTVRSVLTDLVKEGLLYRVQGKGTFVAEKIVTVSPSYIGIRAVSYTHLYLLVFCFQDAFKEEYV